MQKNYNQEIIFIIFIFIYLFIITFYLFNCFNIANKTPVIRK